jgi:heme a synthase
MAKKRLFTIINSITLGSVFILILVGGIVRSTGAGMGCPDWPKCFGSYVPPTSSDHLPDNYLDIFKAKRLEKNERLASIFEKLGYPKLSERITSDPAILQEQEFNVTKAWIEYINRLVGVLIGFLVFLNMIFAFRLKKGALLPILGVAIFALTGFQGWVGSLVVSTNLLHGFITFHMLLALLIVALLIWMNVRAKDLNRISSSRLFYTVIALFVLILPQIIVGTEVRGIVDYLIVNEPDRSTWVNYLSNTFFFHRSYSWLLLISSIALYYFAKREKVDALLKTIKLTVGMFLVTMVAGIGLAYFDFPFWLQPVHLLLGTGIFSLVFYLTLRLKIS